jgi:hypothetical protein
MEAIGFICRGQDRRGGELILTPLYNFIVKGRVEGLSLSIFSNVNKIYIKRKAFRMKKL